MGEVKRWTYVHPYFHVLYMIDDENSFLMVEAVKDFVNTPTKLGPFRASAFNNATRSVLTDLHELFQKYSMYLEPNVLVFFAEKIQALFINMKLFDNDLRDKKEMGDERAAMRQKSMIFFV